VKPAQNRGSEKNTSRNRNQPVEQPHSKKRKANLISNSEKGQKHAQKNQQRQKVHKQNRNKDDVDFDDLVDSVQQ